MSKKPLYLVFYGRWIRPLLPARGRRLMRALRLWWEYRGLMLIAGLSLAEKLRLVARFCRIDLDVPLAHRPSEIVDICTVLFRRAARPGEVVVEAGCWEGGSSAKLSIACKILGHELYIYDSFQGVEPTAQDGYDFTGEYAAEQAVVRRNLERYGESAVCRLFPGWFADTLAMQAVPAPVRAVYIDCDLAKGTYEVLQGVLPSLSDDAVVFSQDYHIEPVRQLLHDPETWHRLGHPQPRIEPLHHHLAGLHFNPPDHQSS
jgi:O-methyltransferase